jgi:NAD(P)-dependent dehydrogenase (short-subunit alcohol dehydrogenase family)
VKDDPVSTELAGRVAFVTGASSGIGQHLARRFASAGADLVLAARRTDRLETLQREIEVMGRRAIAVPMDVTDRASVEAGFAAATDAFGGIDVLLNNAGTAEPQPFLDMTEAAWQRVIETNLTGVWRVAQVAARIMAARGRGAIINVASALGMAPQKSQANYAAAKAAVIQLTRVMALELGSAGVRVNAIAPGYFETEINAEFFASGPGQRYVDRLFPRRLGTLDELDGPVLLLASEAGRFINGTVLPIDGGALLRSF